MALDPSWLVYLYGWLGRPRVCGFRTVLGTHSGAVLPIGSGYPIGLDCPSA